MLLDKYPADNEIDRICEEFENTEEHHTASVLLGSLKQVNAARRPTLLYWLLSFSKSKFPAEVRKLASSILAECPQYQNVVQDVLGPLLPASALPDIPRYRIVQRVGRGGQGEVYEAVRKGTGQRVAIKLLSESHLARFDKRERKRVISQLQSEIRNTSRLNHPNIVKVFEADRCQDGFFFAMQWVDGGNLNERLPELTQVQAARIVRQVAEAVSQAHANGVLHLDIKPQNILYDEVTGQPLLADFGLARLSKEGADSSYIAGTKGFMAPEQAMEGGELDARTDVYGLGATLFNLLTGELPYSSNVRLPYDEAESDSWLAQSPRKYRSEINAVLEHICVKCLEVDPKKRFESCYELIEQLDRFFLDSDARSIARMGKRTLATCPLFFLINSAVMLELRLGWAASALTELLVWLTMFSMYLVVFYVFGSISKLDKYSPDKLALESLWAIWLGKMFAAMSIAASLRLLASRGFTITSTESGAAEVAVLMSYPMFAALTGSACAAMAPRYWRFLYLVAAFCWLNSILLMWSVYAGTTLAPIIYGGSASCLCVLWALKLSQLSKEQCRSAASSSTAETIQLST